MIQSITYHSIFDSERWQELWADPGFFRHVGGECVYHSYSIRVSRMTYRSRFRNILDYKHFDLPLHLFFPSTQLTMHMSSSRTFKGSVPPKFSKFADSLPFF